MIRADGLTKYYGAHPAITDVSFEVGRGEIVGFLGPNAAGKTTTMRILTGYIPPTFGTASVAGFDVLEASLDARRHIGYMPEVTALYTDMRVREYLRFSGRIMGLGRHQLSERLDYVLERCGLVQRADRIIATLSLGFRQRVGVAQAILHDPPVLILDEPTAGLDPNQIIEIRELVKSLAGDHTVLLSTHILPEAQMTCLRVMIINHGRIIAVDTPDNLTARIRDVQTTLVRVRNDGDNIGSLLRSLPGVVSVRVGDDLGSYHIDTPVGQDLRAQISEFVVGKGWGLLELRAVEMSLEDVFRELTTVDTAESESAETDRIETLSQAR